MDRVHDSCQELGNTAQNKTANEKDAAAAKVGDQRAVDEDSNNPNRAENARVLKGIADTGHLKEISSVC